MPLARIFFAVYVRSPFRFCTLASGASKTIAPLFRSDTGAIHMESRAFVIGLGICSAAVAAPSDSVHVKDVLIAKLAAYEPKAEGLYHVEAGTVRIGSHVVAFTPVVETDTEMHGKSVFAMRVELSLDGSARPNATFGAIGIGNDKAEAIAVGLGEWYLGFGRPYFEALANRPPSDTIDGYDVFPGAMGLRGGSPAEWMNGSVEMHRKVITAALPFISTKGESLVLDLKAAVSAKGAVAPECRINGVVSAKLGAAMAALHWPASADGYIFKQAYVLKRHAPPSVESR
jgi:hypothetical protein